MSNTNYLNSEKGSATFELATVFPVLFFLLAGIVDISTALDQYARLTRVAYEGTRHGAAILGLKEGMYTPESLKESYSYSHAQLQARVFDILEEYDFDIEKASITTSRESKDGVSDIVTVKVSYPCETFFSFGGVASNGTLQLTLYSDAPYLYPN